MIHPETKKYPIALPEELSALSELAYNLYWVWQHEIQSLFSEIDPEHWHEHKNPVALLLDTPSERFAVLAADQGFLERLQRAQGLLRSELERETWLQRTWPAYAERPVVYLCAEFGIHTCLPIYSGGLGVLAGDHTKSASDLGIPFIGVGLLYKNGYFTQEIDAEGNQISEYPELNFDRLPIQRILDDSGYQMHIAVPLPGRSVSAQLWLVEVGRSRLILLDTDIPENSEADKGITSQLYGGDRDMRIMQEIVLGMGGVAALRALGVDPAVWHMNEGHVAFSLFERIRELMTADPALTFQKACEIVKINTVFTTHTPVPAGNEAFSLPRIDTYFRAFCRKLGIDLHELIALGLQHDEYGNTYFSMTVLSLRLASKSNGVSKLHGEVSRKMWAHVWQDVPHAQNPITSITNGIHTHTWISQEYARLFDEKLGSDWREQLASREYWQHVLDLPDEAIAPVNDALKRRVIEFVRARLQKQLQRHGADEQAVQEVANWLSPDVLTIGFARRFATYKRATLLFHDLDRLDRIINHPDRPVQIIFAGKAHPADQGGQALIRRIWQVAHMPQFKGKIILIENYDMTVGEHLVQGVDVWLNNPRRPQEASGTSGQKVPVNGGINFSVLDGWWPEAFDGTNGWEIGEVTEYSSSEEQDNADAESLYATLENEIIPLYYGARKDSLHRSWMDIVRNSMASIIPVFNTEVMVRTYFTEMYKFAMDRHEHIVCTEPAAIDSLLAFRREIHGNWPLVHFTAIRARVVDMGGERCLEVETDLYAGELTPEQLEVELFSVDAESDEKPQETSTLQFIEMPEEHIARFKTTQPLPYHEDRVYSLRVFPRHPCLCHKHETGLVHTRVIEQFV